MEAETVKFTIYYRKSGHGLSVDAQFLLNTLRNLGHRCDIEVIEINHRSRMSSLFEIILRRLNILYDLNLLKRLFRFKPRDVAIHLENPIYTKLYRHNIHILVPNQEWMDPRRLDLLESFSYIWCKTRLAKAVFSELGCRTRYIGFYSEVLDLPAPVSKSREHFLSRVGMSQHRGAQILVDTWRDQPDWPLLKLVIHPSRQPANKPANVEYIDVFRSREGFAELAASSLYHIYLTETEGFGHSIVEALGYGSIVMVNDAPPMNEVLDEDCGIMVECSYLGQKRLSPRFGARKSSIEAAVQRILSMTEQEIGLMTMAAQSRYQQMKDEFPRRLDAVIREDLAKAGARLPDRMIETRDKGDQDARFNSHTDLQPGEIPGADDRQRSGADVPGLRTAHR
jgi:glycosyltransferase involved in cell wall biosynthesis